MTRMIDTLAIARTRHPGAKHSLDALCTRYGIDRSHRVKHGALLDAQLLAQVYVELTGGRQIGLVAGGATSPRSTRDRRADGRPPCGDARRPAACRVGGGTCAPRRVRRDVDRSALGGWRTPG